MKIETYLSERIFGKLTLNDQCVPLIMEEYRGRA